MGHARTTYPVPWFAAGAVFGGLLSWVLSEHRTTGGGPTSDKATDHLVASSSREKCSSVNMGAAEEPNLIPRVRDCKWELENLHNELTRVSQDLDMCQGNQVAWPEDLEEKWSEREFQVRVVDILSRIGVEGDTAFYCEEFPCIAHLPDSVDRKRVEELAQADFGDSAMVLTRSHGIVGEYGKRNLQFVSIGPVNYMDEYVRERLDDRLADIIQAVNKDMKLKSDDSKP